MIKISEIRTDSAYAEELYDSVTAPEWECIYQPHQPEPDEPPTRIESIRIVAPDWAVHENSVGDYELYDLATRPLARMLDPGDDCDGHWYWRPVRLGPYGRQHPQLMP